MAAQRVRNWISRLAAVVALLASLETSKAQSGEEVDLALVLAVD